VQKPVSDLESFLAGDSADTQDTLPTMIATTLAGILFIALVLVLVLGRAIPA
jgi:hypothetical protein